MLLKDNRCANKSIPPNVSDCKAASKVQRSLYLRCEMKFLGTGLIV